MPDSCGIVYFKKGLQTLFIDIASDIRRYMEITISNADHDSILSELISSSDSLDWKATESMFAANAEMKIFLSKNNPEYQQQIKLKKDYCYLAIDYFTVPYLKTRSTTEEDFQYIGPFKSQFLIHDIILSFMELFTTPACENEDFPCNLYKEKKCSAYCLQVDKTKLYNDISRFYLSDCTDLLKPIITKVDELNHHLKFQEALYYDNYLNVIKKYLDKLDFFKTVKTLCGEIVISNKKYIIKNGFLTKIIDVDNNQIIAEFQDAHPEYKENELLAIDKANHDELWLNYQILKNKRN